MEWLPEKLIDAQPIDISGKVIPTVGNQTESKKKDNITIAFDFVFCIGGDGTLLRLLRILSMKFRPKMLTKIITLSMGSINYLCNF